MGNNEKCNNPPNDSCSNENIPYQCYNCGRVISIRTDTGLNCPRCGSWQGTIDDPR